MSNFDSGSPKNILFLDVGNTSIKGAYKKGANWKALHPQRVKTALELVKWIEGHPKQFSEVVISSVRNDVKEAIMQQLQAIKLTEISNKDIPPDLLDYETPDTLGVDRFLVCYGATMQTKEAVVVIDAGTATTIDFMGRDKIFHGGVIAPGLESFTGILPEKAPALPKVETEVPKTWPGKSTIDSLKWGQTGFYSFALEAILNRYKNDFGEFDLFITGGNGPLIKKILNRESKLRPFLVFEGMERMAVSSDQ